MTSSTKTQERVRDLFASVGMNAVIEDGALELVYPLENGSAGLPITVEIVEHGPDLFEVQCTAGITMDIDSAEEHLAFLSFVNAVNGELVVSRCFFEPQGEADEADGPEQDDESDESGTLGLFVRSGLFVGGLKQNHFKLLTVHLDAFVDDALMCLATAQDVRATAGEALAGLFDDQDGEPGGGPPAP